MSIINTSAKELHCKILYCGPKGAGKSSSLKYIQKHSHQKQVDSFTLDLKDPLYAVILNMGELFSFNTFIHAYSINTQDLLIKEILLKQIDGILFVANSDPKAKLDNIKTLNSLEHIFLKQNSTRDLFKFPLVFQYNKCDLKAPLSITNLRADLNKYNCKDFASSVVKSHNVLEPLKHLCKLILSNHI